MKWYISFADTEILIKLTDFTTNVEIPENATANTYDFDITKKILFYNSFYETKNFTFGFDLLHLFLLKRYTVQGTCTKECFVFIIVKNHVNG